MKKIIIAALLLAGTYTMATAQEQSSHKTKQYYTLGWNISTPIGGLRDYISPTSISGFTFNGQIYVTDNLGIGFNLTMNNFHDYVDRKTYLIEEGYYMTSSQYRYMNYVPIQVGAYWNFNPTGIVRPYAGFNIGLNYASQSIYISDLQWFDDEYGFHLSPEIGTFIKFGANSAWGMNLSVAYQYNTNSFNFKTVGDVKNLQMFSYSIGISCIID